MAKRRIIQMRRLLSARRPSQTVDLTHITPSYGQFAYRSTIGFYDAAMKQPGEVFLSAEKPTTDHDIAACDAAIAVSIALQYGASVDELRKSITRDEAGRPMGVIGLLLDTIAGITGGENG